VTETVSSAIRAVLREHARLSVDPASLADRSDLFVAGLTSHASITVMLALEDRFDVEFPDEMLTRSVFASIAAMTDAITKLQAQAA
jgi:acyl carrier protein